MTTRISLSGAFVEHINTYQLGALRLICSVRVSGFRLSELLEAIVWQLAKRVCSLDRGYIVLVHNAVEY